jgi:C1A family cysteine protease
MIHHANAASFELLTKRKTSGTDSSPGLSNVLPIVTANGFTLLEGSRVGGTTEHRFRVRHSTGSQQNVSVRFDRSLMGRVDQVRKSHLWIGSRFWAFRAKAYLETYLIEKADYPPGGQLLIEEFSDDEMLLAAHWRD